MKAWFAPLALAAGALLLAVPASFVSPVAGEGLAVLGAAAAIWTFAVGVLPRLRPRDAYDLGELKRVHEREELLALDDGGALGHPETVVCGRCMNEYPYRLGACPKCGQSR